MKSMDFALLVNIYFGLRTFCACFHFCRRAFRIMNLVLFIVVALVIVLQDGGKVDGADVSLRASFTSPGDVENSASKVLSETLSSNLDKNSTTINATSNVDEARYNYFDTRRKITLKTDAEVDKNFEISKENSDRWTQKETGPVYSDGVSHFPNLSGNFSRDDDENIIATTAEGSYFSASSKQMYLIEDLIGTTLSSSLFLPEKHSATSQEEVEIEALNILRGSDAVHRDVAANATALCQKLKCLHGSKCVSDGTFVWCNCSWAHNGFLCESALPLYLVLGLIGAGILLICFLCLNILLCSKLAIKKKEQKADPLDRKLRYVEAFNKTDSTAIYADPANYYGSSLNIRTSSTLPRPRLKLDAPGNKLNGHLTNTDQILNGQNGYYETFQRQKVAAHPEDSDRL